MHPMIVPGHDISGPGAVALCAQHRYSLWKWGRHQPWGTLYCPPPGSRVGSLSWRSFRATSREEAGSDVCLRLSTSTDQSTQGASAFSPRWAARRWCLFSCRARRPRGRRAVPCRPGANPRPHTHRTPFGLRLGRADTVIAPVRAAVLLPPRRQGHGGAMLRPCAADKLRGA